MINNLLSFLTYENIYLVANWGVIPFWFLLIFLPYNQITNFFTQSIIVPLLLAIGYAYLSYTIYLDGNIFDGFELYRGLEGLYSMFASNIEFCTGCGGIKYLPDTPLATLRSPS